MNIAVSLLCEKCMEDMIDVCDSAIQDNAVTGGTFTGMAVIGGIAGGPVGWALAAASLIITAVNAGDAVSFKNKKKDIQEFISNIKSNRGKTVDEHLAVLSEYEEKEKERNEEEKQLNKMLYGEESFSGEGLTCEKILKALEESFLQTHLSSEDFEIIKSELKTLLKKSQVVSVKEINNYLINKLFIEKEKVYSVLDEKVNGLITSEESFFWNEKEYRNYLMDFYKKTENINQINCNLATDNYINEVQDNLIYQYLVLQEHEKERLYNAKVTENEEVLNGFKESCKTIKAELEKEKQNTINKWKNAEEKLTAEKNQWLKKFISKVNDKIEQWNKSYISFVEEKTKWINTQYVYAVNIGNAKLLDSSGMDVEKEINSAIREFEVLKEDKYESAQKYVKQCEKEIFSDMVFTNTTESFDETKLTGLKPQLSKYDVKISGKMEKLNNIKNVLENLNTELEKESALIAARLVENQFDEMLDSYMKKLETENLMIHNWEKKLVTDNGYRYGDVIDRTVTVDASYFGAKRKNQTVHKYEDFKIARPDIKVSFGQNDSDVEILNTLQNAQNKLAGWDEEIFGKSIETVKVDIDGNLVKSVEISEHEVVPKKKAKDNSDIKENEFTIKVRDGKFGEYLGYAPVFDEQNLNFKKSAEKNLLYEGDGEIGKIMLDFQWNQMQYNYGVTQLSLPAQEKKLWLGDGFIEAPTLAGVTDIALNILGDATGQSWLGFTDDIIFGLLDITIEGKDASEAGLELAKKVAVQAVSQGTGSISNKVSSAVNSIENAAGRVILSGLNAGVTSYGQTAVSSAINNVYIDATGNLKFNLTNFGKSLYSRDTLAKVFGAGINTGVTSGVSDFLLTDGNKEVLTKTVFNTKALETASQLSGSAMAALSEYLLSGHTDINLINTSMFGLKNIKDNFIVKKGLFALSFDKEKGISSSFSSSGYDMNIGNFITAMTGLNDINKIASAKISGVFGNHERISTLNALNYLGYTDLMNNVILSNDIWNDEVTLEYGEPDDNYGKYLRKTNRIILNSNLSGGGKEAAARLATVLAHKGTHVYDNRIEGIAHLFGLETYAQINRMFGLDGDSSFAGEMIDAIMDKNSWKENVGDTDHWRVLNNGDLLDDGLDDRVSFEDGRETIYYGKKSKQGTLEKYLGIEKDEGYSVLLKAAGYELKNGKWVVDGEKKTGTVISREKIQNQIEAGKITNSHYYSPEGKIVAGLNYIQNSFISIFGSKDEKSKLQNMQKTKIEDLDYQQGSKGPYNYSGATADTTWCNMATLGITFETAYALSMALRSSNDPYGVNTNANSMYDNLLKASQDKESGIIEITAEKAQELANLEYTVVGSWQNPDLSMPGHIATVEPGHKYDAETGPYFGNVGKQSSTGDNKNAIQAFGSAKIPYIKYYYCPTQFSKRRY